MSNSINCNELLFEPHILYRIEGIIEPSLHRSVKICRFSTDTHSSKLPPMLSVHEDKYTLNEYLTLMCTFDTRFKKEVEPDYWKMRIWTHFVLSSPMLLSISFFPSNRSKSHLLFLQKKDIVTQTTGFIAPYLGEKDQKMYSGETCFPSFYLIQDDATIDQSLNKWVNESVRAQIKEILQCFLYDTETLCLTTTFLNGTDFVTCGWLKQF